MDPLQYAARVLDLYGAVVEAASGPAAGAEPSGTGPEGISTGRLEALLPADLAARLDWEEETLLAVQAAAAGGEWLIGYGSADLEKLLDLLRGDCSVIRLRGHLPWPHARSLAHEASTALRFRTRVRMTYRETQASHASYVLAHYALNAVSEETYEKLVTAFVNQATLSPVPALTAHIDDARLFASRAGGPASSGGLASAGCPWPKICTALHRAASRAALEQLRPFVDRLERRRSRDAERLHDYYEALAQELGHRRARGRQLSAARVEEKLASIRAEYERKVRDLDLRYSLRVTLRPVAAAQVEMPVLRGTYQLQWRSTERMLPITWNPLLRSMEPIACDDCGQGGLEMTIDDRLHVRCGSCAAGAC